MKLKYILGVLMLLVVALSSCTPKDPIVNNPEAVVDDNGPPLRPDELNQPVSPATETDCSKLEISLRERCCRDNNYGNTWSIDENNCANVVNCGDMPNQELKDKCCKNEKKGDRWDGNKCVNPLPLVTVKGKDCATVLEEDKNRCCYENDLGNTWDSNKCITTVPVDNEESEVV